MAEWSCSGLQSRLRRFDSDPSLISPVLRRTKKINGVAKGPEHPAPGAYLDVMLKRAREKRDDVHKLVADGVAPKWSQTSRLLLGTQAPHGLATISQKITMTEEKAGTPSQNHIRE